MKPEAEKGRRPSARTAVAAVGVLGLAGAVTLTMAQWTDDAEVGGEVSTGNFELSVTPGTLGFDGTEFVPDQGENSEHTLSNDSSVDADVDLQVSATGETGIWELTVATPSTDPEAEEGDWSVRDTVDPAEGGTVENLGGGEDGSQLTLDPDEDIEVRFTLTLDVEGNEGQTESLEDIALVFEGTQAD